MKKKLKKFAIITGILLLAALTLFILWTSWENWSGAREWEKTREMLENKEVALTLEALRSATPAEDRNFCAAPIIASLLQFDQGREAEDLESVYNDGQVKYREPEQRERLLQLKIPHVERGAGFPDWRNAVSADLDSVGQAIAKTDAAQSSVLEWMAQFQDEIDQLDAAAKRPEAIMPSHFSDDFIANISIAMPELFDFQQLTKFQMIRACAALEAADNGQAIAALEGIFKIQQACASQPTLVGYLISQASLESSLSVIWHGMANDLWTTNDLLWIQTRLGEIDLMPALERSLNFEMVAVQMAAAEYLKDISFRDSLKLARIIEPLGSGKPSESSPIGLVSLLVPNGIWDHNKSYGCRFFYEHGILPVRERRIPDTTAISDIVKNRSYRTFLASFTVPAISKLIQNAYHSAVALELAKVACAVERHGLDTGNYCESLDELVPKYLTEIPTDLAAPSAPLRYGRGLHGDRYRIYSIGQNRTDEGGIPSFKKNGKRATDSGDWVWGYRFQKPAEEAE